jgi:hypothetical protein
LKSFSGFVSIVGEKRIIVENLRKSNIEVFPMILKGTSFKNHHKNHHLKVLLKYNILNAIQYRSYHKKNFKDGD